MDISPKSKKRLKISLISLSILIVIAALPKVIYKAATLYERQEVKSLNDKWLPNISLVADPEIPVVNWVEDTLTSKGINSFLLLDRYCDDVKYIVHTTWPLPPSAYYWWKSRLGGDYFFTTEQKTEPDYHYEKNDSSLYILTKNEPDTWIYLPSRVAQPARYALDFDYCPMGDQYETLQIDVRMKTLANRFKFVVRYNKDIKFDMCVQSNFLSSSSDERWSKFIKPLSFDKTVYSHIRVEMIDDIYSFIVNGKRILSVRVKDSSTFGPYWCLMSWNTFQGGVPCEIGIKNFRILHDSNLIKE